MRFSYDCCDLLVGISLDEDDKLPFIGNFLKEEEIFSTYGKTLYGYLRFINSSLRNYHRFKRIESYNEYLDRIYPPIEILEEPGTDDW